jgi:acetyl-CoA acetyltransferase
MKEVVVVEVVRTPIGKRGGALSQTEPIRFGARVLNEAVRRLHARARADVPAWRAGTRALPIGVFV